MIPKNGLVPSSVKTYTFAEIMEKGRAKNYAHTDGHTDEPSRSTYKWRNSNAASGAKLRIKRAVEDAALGGVKLSVDDKDQIRIILKMMTEIEGGKYVELKGRPRMEFKYVPKKRLERKFVDKVRELESQAMKVIEHAKYEAAQEKWLKGL